MRKVFISYRRADSAAEAGRIYDRLSEQFGEDRVFMDVDDIRPGEDYVEAIERRIDSCDTLIVLIGPTWISATNDSGQRRLDDPTDLARIEVEIGLRRNIRVIPILVSGAEMPESEELPDSLQPLLRRHAVQLSHATFHNDVNLLLEKLGRKVKRQAPRRLLWVASGGVAVILLLIAIGLAMPDQAIPAEEGEQAKPSSIASEVVQTDPTPADLEVAQANSVKPPSVTSVAERPVRTPSREPARPAPVSVQLVYANDPDPYGCLLNLSLTIDGQTFMPTSNPYSVQGLNPGLQQYELVGTIQCTTLGSCSASGSGQLQVRAGATYNVMWQNVAVGQCRAWLVQS